MMDSTIWPAAAEPQPPELAQRLRAGQVVVLVGRSSGNEPRLAVEDLIGAAEALDAHTGLRVAAALPPAAQLVERLRAQATVAVAGRDATRKKRYRFLDLDLRPTVPVMLVVITGSGRALNAKDTQPVVEHIADVVRGLPTAVLAAKRPDRLGRVDFGLAPVVEALRDGEVLLGTQDQPPRPFDQVASLLAFLQGSSANAEAGSIHRKTRASQRRNTGTVMVAGRATVRIGAPPVPPGFALARLRDGTGGPGAPTLFIDGPGSRPTPEEVTFGLPEVYDADGKPVDQVGHVRFLLARIGRDEWPAKKLLRWLDGRGFSTQGMRQRKGLAATYGMAGKGSSERGYALIGKIVDHLDVYETGELSIEVGDGEDPVVLSGCIPQDGPWATAEDFARIRRYAAATQDRQDRRAALSFGGLDVTYDGAAAVLLTAPADHRAESCDVTDTDRSYYFVHRDRYRRPEKRTLAMPGRIRLPWQALHESIIDAVERAGELPVRLFDDVDLAPEVDVLRRKLEGAVQRSSELRRRCDGLAAQLVTTGADGSTVLTGPLLKRINAEYNAAAAEVAAAEAAEQQLRNELDLAVHHTSGVGLDQLLRLVEELSESSSALLRGLLHSDTIQLEFTHRRETGPLGEHTVLEWTGKLLFTDEDNPYQIDIAGIWRSNDDRVRRVHDRITETIEAMTAGTPWPTIAAELSMNVGGYLERRVAQQLNPNLEPGGLLPAVMAVSCPLIPAAATRLLLNPGRTDRELAAELDCEEALIARIRTVHLEQEAVVPWQRQPPKIVQAAVELACRNGGPVTAGQIAEAAGSPRSAVYTTMSKLRTTSEGAALWESGRKRGYELAPCGCGALAWQLPTTPEPVGMICTGCGRDQAGIRWAASTFIETEPEVLAQ